MSEHETEIGIVGQTVKDILPMVNEGFNWEVVKNRFDPDPVGKAMSLHFTDEQGKEPVEKIHLGIAQGEDGEPELVFLENVGPEWGYLGVVTTYQDFGIKILDPNNPMDAERARYQHRGIKVSTPEGTSTERTWMVVSKVLDIMLESHVHKQAEAKQGGD